MNDATFADLLRRHRRQRGFTQEALAERSGISTATISLLERNLTQVPQRFTLQALRVALDLSDDEADHLARAAQAARASSALQDDRVGLAGEADGGLPHGALPLPLTTLVGREHDLGVLCAQLRQRTTRLVTLTGPAGVGKTRIALEAAATLRSVDGRDVIFVGLIPVREPERVLPAIAHALGLRPRGAQSVHDALIGALRERSCWLVLDNFEQVLMAAPALARVLVACPDVKALVTSRSPLNIRGEHCFPIRPLALPSAEERDSPRQLAQAPAVALFLERAQAAQPGFTLDSLENARLVASICERLDGLPLAIELAAARMRHFGVRQLAVRLALPTLLGTLSDGPQDMAAHQRTMRATIAWSYHLLTAGEQRLFRWLGVFVGGASLDAISAVTDLADEMLPERLATLVEAHLVRCRDVAGTPRYSQLVTLQAFAREQLCSAGEMIDAQRRHAIFFRQAAEAFTHQTADGRERLLRWARSEDENVRAALVWARESGCTEVGLALSARLWNLWFTHGPFLEGLEWLRSFIERATPPTSQPTSNGERRMLADAWTGVIAIAHRLDRHDEALRAAEHALALERQLGEPVPTAYALMHLGIVVAASGDYAQALALYEESLGIFSAAHHGDGMIVALLNVGQLHAEQGDLARALLCYEESLALSRKRGESDLARALTWNNVGDVYLRRDDPMRAVEVVEPAYRLFVSEHDTFGIATSALTIGRAYARAGDSEAARAYLGASERLFRSLGNVVMAAEVLCVLAGVALATNDPAAARRSLQRVVAETPACGGRQWLRVTERVAALALCLGERRTAALLYGAANGTVLTPPMMREPSDREERERSLALLCAEGSPAVSTWLQEGESLDLDAVLALMRQTLGLECSPLLAPALPSLVRPDTGQSESR